MNCKTSEGCSKEEMGESRVSRGVDNAIMKETEEAKVRKSVVRRVRSNVQ